METKEKTLEQSLLGLGLTKSEIAVYFVLLKNGTMPTSDISKLAGLPRSTTVISLENLLKEGLIKYFEIGKRRSYLINEPKDILNLFSKRESEMNLKKIEITKAIPELESLYNIKAVSDIVVEKLSGEIGFKKAYDMNLDQKTGGEILRFGLSVKKFNFFNDYLKEYVQKKNKKKITTRLLLPKDESGLHLEVKKDDKSDLRETRFLDPNVYNPQGNIAIWGNMVSFISWDKEFHIIIVKDKYFADMMRMIFNSIWG